MSGVSQVVFNALLLTAGRSSRMGRDKALLEVERKPLWVRQRELLSQAGARQIWLSARADQAWVKKAQAGKETAFDAVVADEVADGGPLAGIAAGLKRATASGASHLAVLAVDLPRMRAEWFDALRAESADDMGCVGRRGEFFEPLAAIYPVALAVEAEGALARGEGSLQKFLAGAVRAGRMREREIGTEEAGWFENWNEPAAVREG